MVTLHVRDEGTDLYFLVLVGSIQHGSCTVQPSVINFSSEELVDMISRCGLNRLHQFATFLSIHLRHARLNPKLLAHMRSLDAVLFAGLPLPQEDEDYAYKSGLHLVVSCQCIMNLYSD